MKNYTSYELVIKPMSSFLTSMQSDIIFGHIIWAASRLDGEDKASDILNQVRQKSTIYHFKWFSEECTPKINNIKIQKVLKKYLNITIWLQEQKNKTNEIYEETKKKKAFVTKRIWNSKN